MFAQDDLPSAAGASAAGAGPRPGACRPGAGPTTATIRRQMSTLLVHAEACQAIQAQQQAELSLAEFKALAFLNAYGQLPTGQLKLLMDLSPGGVTALINRLEAAGHLRRSRLPGDRRVVALLPVAPPGEADHRIGRLLCTEDCYSAAELSLIQDFLDRCTHQLSHSSRAWLDRRNAGLPDPQADELPASKTD